MEHFWRIDSKKKIRSIKSSTKINIQKCLLRFILSIEYYIFFYIIKLKSFFFLNNLKIFK